MKKILWLVFTTLLVALISCEKNETIDPFSSEGSNDGKIIDNNLISLNERIEFTKSPLLYTFYDPDPDLKGSLYSFVIAEGTAGAVTKNVRDEITMGLISGWT